LLGYRLDHIRARRKVDVSVWFYQSSAGADLVCLIDRTYTLLMSTAAAGRSRTSFVSYCCQSTSYFPRYVMCTYRGDRLCL